MKNETMTNRKYRKKICDKIQFQNTTGEKISLENRILPLELLKLLKLRGMKDRICETTSVV